MNKQAQQIKYTAALLNEIHSHDKFHWAIPNNWLYLTFGVLYWSASGKTTYSSST